MIGRAALRRGGRCARSLLALSLLSLVCGCITPAVAPAPDEPLTPYSPLHAQRGTITNPTPSSDAPSVQSHLTASRAPTSDDEELLKSPEKRTFSDWLSDHSPNKMTKRFKEKIGLGPDEELAKKLYTDADLKFRQKQYAEAAKLFKKAGNRWPDSMLEEDAMFMRAESYFQIDKYPKTSDVYTVLMKKYNNSRHLDMVVKRRFSIARYWDTKGRDRAALNFNWSDKTIPFWDVTGNMVAVYESIRMDDPTGPLADDATMATANALFLKGRYEDAGYHYDLMRTEFPQSEFQAQAHLLCMECKLQSYQGPQYDDKPLRDAAKLAKTIRTQYAQQLPDEREHIAQVEKAIDAQMAERDWSLGEFYDKTFHYGAARYYYNAVLEKHPESRFADMAKTRIASIKDKPPEPANEIEWVARQFRRAPKPAADAAAPDAKPADQPALVQQPPGAPTSQSPQSPPVVAQQPQPSQQPRTQ
ncbi:MAG TPA: outer membrane protein assembly factor BamD [Pirellulales bacterium]|jgi:outer membrane protein assembly factor BamD (BamD/ComL family)